MTRAPNTNKSTTRRGRPPANRREDGDETQPSITRVPVPEPADYDPRENLLAMEIPPPPEPVMNADGSGARLVITHIDVENFKSYFGRQTIGPMHKVITLMARR